MLFLAPTFHYKSFSLLTGSNNFEIPSSSVCHIITPPHHHMTWQGMRRVDFRIQFIFIQHVKRANSPPTTHIPSKTDHSGILINKILLSLIVHKSKTKYKIHLGLTSLRCSLITLSAFLKLKTVFQKASICQ